MFDCTWECEKERRRQLYCCNNEDFRNRDHRVLERPTDPLKSESRSELSENRSRDQSGEVSNSENGSVLWRSCACWVNVKKCIHNLRKSIPKVYYTKKMVWKTHSTLSTDYKKSLLSVYLHWHRVESVVAKK